MATQRNPVNTTKYIDLSETLVNLTPAYGYFAEGGLFDEQGINQNFHGYQIEDQEKPVMTKLTSRTERDAVALTRARKKMVTMAGITSKITGGVHVEDLINQTNGFVTLESDTLQDAMGKEMRRMYNTGSANFEYLVATATQGRVRDPEDGSVAIDQFANTGITQTQVTIDLAPASDLNGQLTTLANQMAVSNGYNGSVNMIEIVLGDEAFTALVNHPDISTAYQLAYQGTGAQALAQPFFVGTQNRVERTQYGFRRQFMWENFVFTTYPQVFNRMDGTTTNLVEALKGWTVLRDIADLYQVKYTPSPYFSQFSNNGQRWYARTTGIVDDTHVDMTLETHNIPFVQRPEVVYDVTFTV